MFHKDLAGQDLHAPSQQFVENDTGVDIPAMKAVTYNGIGTNWPSIVLANGATSRVRGITQVDMPNGSAAYITCLGFLYNVNTSAWPEGTSLYADASGNLITTPTGSVVATVYIQNATTGLLYVENAFLTAGGAGDVVGPSSSTDRSIAVWDGTTGQLLEDGPGTHVQPSGAVTAQLFITNTEVTGTVVIGANQVSIAPGLNIESTGSIDLSGGGQLLVFN
jgi:hypothetical protein